MGVMSKHLFAWVRHSLLSSIQTHWVVKAYFNIIGSFLCYIETVLSNINIGLIIHITKPIDGASLSICELCTKAKIFVNSDKIMCCTNIHFRFGKSIVVSIAFLYTFVDIFLSTRCKNIVLCIFRFYSPKKILKTMLMF